MLLMVTTSVQGSQMTKRQQTHPYWTHSLPNISLEDLKTLTLSVQALWMFTIGSSPEVSPIISFPS